ncbi:MAG: hypothetical protein ACRD51_10340 [Candidatus Acidiferrum sp.]
MRLYLAVSLFNGHASFPCYGLIDSGADDCIFPASFARYLGFELASGKTYRFGGVASLGQEAYFFDLEMVIAGIIPHKLAVGFTTSLDQRGHGLLGQNGFFDRFAIRFDHRKRSFSIYT